MAQLLLTGTSLSASSNLDEALLLLEARLAAWASNTEAYNALLLEVFGAQGSDATTALQTPLSGSGLGISLQILDGTTAGGFNGAYTSAAPEGGEAIYLNADWLQSATAADIEAVLLEEIGHAIDDRLNGDADTKGDEGEIFSALLRGLTPTNSAFSENDQQLISLSGVTVAIEAAADTTPPTGSLGSYATAPAYSAASTNPFGIRDVGFYANPAFADLDGDGDLDLFIGNSDGNTLVFTNTATPGASAPAYSAPATNPFGITDVGSNASPALADLDGDGDLDLFIGNSSGNTLVFTNTAAAGASAPAYSAPATNPFGITDEYFRFGASPALADLDGDGDLDLFIGNSMGNTLVFTNTATPGASAPAYSAPATNPFGITDVGSYASPTLADLDGDGDLDLFIGNNSGNTLVFTNTATPGATAPAYSAPATNPFGITDVGSYASPTLADLDGDGDLDLFIGNFNGNTLVFTNAPTPVAVAPVSSSTANGTYGIGAVITLTVQFSEDVLVTGTPQLQLETGAVDRFATYSSGSNSDTLSFQYTVQAGDTSPDLDQLSANALTLNGGTIRDAAGNNAILTLAAPGTTGSLAANAQFVIDGTPPTGSLLISRIGGAPAYSARSTNPFGIRDVGLRASPAFADLDGDGDLDLFIGNSAGNTLVFTNTAAPGATAPAYRAPATNPFGITDVGFSASPAFADLDGDGDLDLFIGNRTGNTLVFTNTRSATAPAYSARAINPFGITGVGSYASPAFADLDGDGDLDLFIGNSDGNTLVFTNTGTATAPSYSAPATNPFGITDVGLRASPAFADLDGDGDLDLFIGNIYGNTLVFTNTGTATAPAYSAPATNPFGITDVGFSASPALADLDGDGDLDLFIGNSRGNTRVFTNTAVIPVAPVASSTANGTYGIGAVITLTVGFSEDVLVTGTPRLQLETGAIDRFATYSSGSGTNTLSFQYTVQAGDASPDLDQLSANSLTLNGGTIRDAVGNNAILTLAAPGATGSLAANAQLEIGGVPPVITAGPTAVGDSAVNLTVNEAGTAYLLKADSTTLFPTAIAANTAATLTLAAQAAITKATLQVVDAAGNLTLTTAPTFWLGTTGADLITGTKGADFLYGFAGNDTLRGGDGDDTYIVDAGGDVVTETNADPLTGGIDTILTTVSRTLGSNQENLVLLGGAGANLSGTGNSLNNTITGTAGANVLNGGLGADTLIGGLGNDVYTVDNAADVVIELAGEGRDGVKASIDYTLGNNLENLTLTGSANLSGTGNALNNTITGNAGANILSGGDGNDSLNGALGADILSGGDGNDYLDGGQGADTLIGGLGNDVYTVDNAADVVIERAAEGTDLVFASIDYTLDNNLENLTLTGSANLSGTGNALNNTITGNAGANILSGGDGNDYLDGGQGADTLIGGLGADTFRFWTTLDAANVDSITDFSLAEGDRIQLENAVFTTLSTTSSLILNFSAFGIGAAATTAAQRILYNTFTGGLSYDSDGSGATAAVAFATLGTGLALTYSSFLVI